MKLHFGGGVECQTLTSKNDGRFSEQKFGASPKSTGMLALYMAST